jgi:hypothetical protein
LIDGRDGGKGASMSCAMVYWGGHYDAFFDIFIRFGAVLDLRPPHRKEIGDSEQILQPVLLSEF